MVCPKQKKLEGDLRMSCYCPKQFDQDREGKGRNSRRNCLLQHREEAGANYTKEEKVLPKNVWLHNKQEQLKTKRGQVNFRTCGRWCQTCQDLDIPDNTSQNYPGIQDCFYIKELIIKTRKFQHFKI